MGTANHRSLINKEENEGTQAQEAFAPMRPRLLDVHATAIYLGVSQWTVRDILAGGILSRVRVPLPNHRELRKLLFDRNDLDRLIETWKETGW